MERIVQTTKQEEKLTRTQFDALHLWFRQLSEVLRSDGYDMRKKLDYPIIPTEESVKEMIFKPILLATFGKKSTKDLAKQKEIDDCYDTICAVFAEIGITIPPFPNRDDLLISQGKY